MLSKTLLKKIEERYGEPIEYPKQLDALIGDIFNVTRAQLSISTAKRLFGFVGDSERIIPRKNTMDILAQYLGYPNYKLLASDLGNDADISDFVEVKRVVSDDIAPGTQIQLMYDPNRVLVLTFLGENKYIVNESVNSKLCQGDILTITHISEGFALLVVEVSRNGKSLGAYSAAKEGGISSITVVG